MPDETEILIIKFYTELLRNCSVGLEVIIFIILRKYDDSFYNWWIITNTIIDWKNPIENVAKFSGL